MALVRVGGADANGNWVNGDVHHDQKADLHGGAHVGQVEAAGAGVAGGGGLEDGCGETGAAGEFVDLGVVEVEDYDENDVDDVHDNKNGKEYPGGFAGEEKGVAAPGMFEEKIQRLTQRGSAWAES